MNKNEQWPQSNSVENHSDQLNEKIEKAENAMKQVVIEKIKSGSPEEANEALEDLMVFTRIIQTVSVEVNEAYDLSAAQEQIDEIAKKYSVGDLMFSTEEIHKLAEKL
jgi:hypothetical protein